MTILRKVGRVLGKTAVAIYILLASCTYAILVVKYALGRGSKVSVQNKNLRMIKSTGKSIKGAVKVIRK